MTNTEARRDAAELAGMPKKSRTVIIFKAAAHVKFVQCSAFRRSLRTGPGKTELIYQLPLDDRRMECHEPRPLTARPREVVIAPHVALSKPTGSVVLQDVYAGRNMAGVKRGEIKKLLVLQQLPSRTDDITRCSPRRTKTCPTAAACVSAFLGWQCKSPAGTSQMRLF